MSYPPLSGYYSSSAQSSSNANNTNNAGGYSSSSRNADNSTYSSSMNNTSNSTQPTSYSSSGYGWSGQSAYANPAPAEQSNETYPQSSCYDYQRSNTYESQPTASMNNSYSRDYYGQSTMRQNQQSAQNQNEGLSNLAYASGLESANSRSSTTSNTQPYEIPSSQQQSRVRSPIESQTRYCVNPPAITSSYPMRQQGSSSSASSNQLAMDAAAALAGAVGRRNANNVQYSSLSAPRESSGMSNARSNMSSAPRRTASPQIDTASRSHQSYASSQSQPQQQQQQQPQPQRIPPPIYSGTSSQNTSRQAAATPMSNAQSHSTSRQVPPAPVSNVQSQQTSTNQGSQHRYGTRSSPRSIRQTGSIAHLVTAAHEAESDERSRSPEAQDTNQTFIDPTSIFDPYAQERERRRQAAERAAIEAEKQAEEDAKREAAEDARAEELRKQNKKEAAEAAERKRLQDKAEAQKRQAAARFVQSNSGSRRKSKETPASALPAVQTEEERMAAELKAMMEKMKAFQSKDPSLFKKLWDDMRKPGPTTTTITVDTPSPQLAQQSLPTPDSRPQPSVQPEVVAEQTAAKKSTPRRPRKTQLGPDGQPLRLNGYAVVVEDNPEHLPDLGRFPAERRIRQTYTKPRTGDNVNAEDDSQIMGQESASPPATEEQPACTTATVPTPASMPTPTSSKAARATPAALSQASLQSTAKSTGATTTTKSTSGTIWPLEKRNALTSTALKALKAIPENASVSITEEDLYKILENNPSYIDLCQQLEAKGLKFHRGHFARELLNSVPDLKGGAPTSHPTPAPSTRQPVGANTVEPSAVSQPPPPQPTNLYQHPHPPPPPPQYGHVPPHPYPSPHYGPPNGQFAPPTHYGFGVLHPPNQSVPPTTYSIAPSKGGFPARPQPPLGSKEAAARKRDFMELIDLTELGDNDNYVLPDKHPRVEGPDSADEMDTDPFQAYQTRREPAPAPYNQSVFPPPSQPVQYNAQFGQPGQIQKQESFPELKGQRHLLAKPLNKEEALKKQFYDPKTVARDLLIATGRHPLERPLNVHLAGMLGKYIELDSDVDTFDWDEIDPGGPPIPKVEMDDVPASKPRFKLGERVHRKRKARPLSTSVVDKARRPDKENHANGVTSPTMQPAADIATSTTSKSTPLKNQLRKEAFKKPASKLRHSLLASDEQATPAQFDPTKPPQVQSDSLPSKPASTTKPLMSQESTPRRRPGRPPGSKNKFLSVAGLKAQASDMKVKVNVPHRDATPPTKEKFKCKWKKCSTVLHNLDTLRKHIGRIHRPSSTDATNEGYTCWWKKCKYLKQDENTGDWVTTKVFDHWEEWLKHIEKEHVTPIAIRWGDGPATNHVGKHKTPSRS